MESIENRLFDLLEKFSYEALSEDDKLFVLSQMTEQGFRNQQKVLLAADELVYPAPAPLPLVIPSKKSGFWMSPVPLYQIFLGAAAAIIAVILLWPKENDRNNLTAIKPETIYKTEIVHDTVFERIEKEIPVAMASIPETVYIYQQSTNLPPPERMLEVNQTNSAIKINPSDLTSNTKSMKNDETAKLLPEVPEFGL